MYFESFSPRFCLLFGERIFNVRSQPISNSLYAECLNYLNVMLIVVMLNVVMLSVVVPTAN
jgi:hypothetical protein